MFGKTTPQPSPSLSAPPQGSEFIKKKAGMKHKLARKWMKKERQKKFSESVRQADGGSLNVST
jgi:hypothetical protein